MYFGRASTRPYSYAMCVIAVIYSLLHDGCSCSYAMITNAGNVGASGSSPAFCPPCLRCVVSEVAAHGAAYRDKVDGCDEGDDCCPDDYCGPRRCRVYAEM